MRTLQQCLLDIDLVQLRAIARFWDVDLTATRHRDAAAELADAMAAQEAVTASWEALPATQRGALEALQAAGGHMPLRVFAREWGEIRTMGPGRLEREQPWRAPISPAEGLWYRGFIARAFDREGESTYEVIFIPPELRPYLQAHLPARPAPPAAIAMEPIAMSPIAMGPIVEPMNVRSAGDPPSGDALLDDAVTLLAYLQNERMRPGPDGTWPARHRASLAPRLRDPDPARLDFLLHLARRLEWLRVTDACHLRPDPGPVATWLQSPVREQRRALASAWRDDAAWNDLFHVPTLHPEDTGAWRNDPLVARRAVLGHLKATYRDPATWYALDDFVRAIKQADPDFQRPDGDYATWYIRDATTGTYLTGFESWDWVEGALIRYLITAPLAWLGLVDVGAAPPDGLTTVFRLTWAGATFLSLAEMPPEPECAPLTLHADFTVHVPPARRYERFQLARVADWASTPATAEDGYIYRITPDSLARAREQGIPVARILEFLGQMIDAPLPRFVEAALTRWEARGTETRLERAVLLRLSSEELLAQIASSPPARRLLGEQVGPTAILVREGDWRRLVPALGELGLLPNIVSLEEI